MTDAKTEKKKNVLVYSKQMWLSSCQKDEYKHQGSTMVEKIYNAPPTLGELCPSALVPLQKILVASQKILKINQFYKLSLLIKI